MSTDAAEMAERIQRALHLVRNSPYIPKRAEPSAPQWAFIASDELEVLYAGAVGGGKSHALLAAALMYAHVPGYSALIIRKNFPDLAQPGGLMSMANEWLGDTDAHKRDGGKVWEFPSGATLRFGHIETPGDWIRYQGGEYQFIGIDELPTLEQEIWENLKSRLRRSTTMHPELAEVPDRIRGTGNPGGRHALWVKEYFISDSHGKRVVHPDRLFIPSRLTDNPHLDADAYVKILDGLDPLRRAQMRDGDWDILPQGTMFNEESFAILPGKLSGNIERVRSWDLAGSAKTKSDYCVGSLVARNRDTGEYRVEHVIRAKMEPGPLEEKMRQTAALDGKGVRIIIEEERSGAGKLVIANYRRVLKGYHVIPFRPTTDKVTRAGLFSAVVDRGELSLTQAAWNKDVTDECVGFPEGAHDDIVDSISMAVHHLARWPVNGSPAPTARQPEPDDQRLAGPNGSPDPVKNRTFYMPGPPPSLADRVRRSPFADRAIRSRINSSPTRRGDQPW